MSDPQGETTGHVLAERMPGSEHLRFLAEASKILADSLDYETELERVAHLAIPNLADWCVIDLLGEDGYLHRLAIVHRDPAKAEVAAELKRRYPKLAPDQSHTVWRVLPAGPPWFDPQITETRFVTEARDAEHLALLRQLGFSAEMVLPLIARGRPLGAFTLVLADSSRHYGPHDLALAQELAHRAALAIDNARLYQEAQNAIRVRDQFLSIAAHELRNPVTVVKGTADLLSRAVASGTVDERQRKLVQNIAKAADRLVALTDDLLDISRIQVGQLQLQPEHVDLRQLVDDVGSRYREQLAGQHRLELELPAAPCPIVADASRLEQVLVNLLDNAVKYSPEGGAIEVAVREEGAGALIQVRDEGIGLPPRAAETIFEPFGRGANTRGIPGMGLGLSICRSIVERHGGRIWAESRGEGCGTTLTVWLPYDGPG